VGLGIRGEPRKILRKLRRWSFKEMEGADECCGMGGSFRLFHPGVSARISGEKLERVRQAEVDAVATSCMGCWMGLKEMLHRESKEIQVKHICELVWEEMEDAGSSSLESGGQI
jgi:glycolate oxidase iron-sulfur subunit